MTITLLIHQLVRLAIAALVIAAAATTAISAQQEANYEIVSSFSVSFLNGENVSSMRQADDGTFYGTTRQGGLFDEGVLFRLDTTGVVTPLHHFFDSTDGIGPFGVVRTPDGRFYGITERGGPGDGTLFSFTPAGGFTVVHVFLGTESQPVDLFVASDGNVYGLTRGNNLGNGIIFMIDPDGTFRTIHNLPSGTGNNKSSLVKGSDGRFYVTARGGGALSAGILFSIDDIGTLTILHNFGDRSGDGFGPSGLIQGRDGRLYGTTISGGAFTSPVSACCGTVYSIALTGDGYRVLHSFNGFPEGSASSLGMPDLLEVGDGIFYGLNSSRLFTIDSTGILTVLHDFTPRTGTQPGEVIEGTDGRLYGTMASAIFTRDGTALTTLYVFTRGEGVDGRPNGVIQSRDGQFYGTTGANPFDVPAGTVFRMDAGGARSTLYMFQFDSPTPTGASNGVPDGSPMSNLFEDADGSLYGTTFNTTLPEFAFDPGQIFKLSPAGDFTSLAPFYGLRAGLIRAGDGRLYFTEGASGLTPTSFGSVRRIEANGSVTTLHRFVAGESGNPVAELVEIDDGTLYGTTAGGHGTIFQIDPVTGTFTTRYRFSGPDGSGPLGRLIQGTDGLVYGTTSRGGAYGFGTVFSLDAAGTLTTVHHFAGPDGAGPHAGVLQGADGRLYGTTRYGGASGYGTPTLSSGHGTLFVLNVIGGLTTLHHFAFSDGANPVNELIQANDGALYGAAPMGGPGNSGVIFRVRLETSPPPTGEFFEIVSRNSDKCLDVYGASTDAAAQVIQWTCHGGPNQQWRLEPAGGGAFRIIARHSGQALDVYGALLDDVAPIIQWPVHGGDNQAWTLEPASDGYVRLVVRHSGKAMDVEFASTDDGARVIQYTPHGGANQQWLLRPVESTSTPVTTVNER